MVLTKEETIAALQNEVRLVLHLMSKIESSMLDYRPSPKQRSLLDLCRYFIPMAPVQLRFVIAGDFTMEKWAPAWTAEASAANAMNLEEVKSAVAKQSALSRKCSHPFRTRIFARKSKCSATVPRAACRSCACQSRTSLPIECSCFCI